MGYSDQQLREAVDAVFGQFDKDNSGSLDCNEVFALINAAMQKMGSNQQLSQDQVQQFVNEVDTSKNGKIEKMELFQIFRKCLPAWSVPKHISIHLYDYQLNQ